MGRPAAATTAPVPSSCSTRWACAELGWGRDPDPEEADIANDARPVEDYPAAAAALADGTVFGSDLDPDSSHQPTPAAAALLRRIGMRFVVGTGAFAGDQGWLLTMYGASDHVPVTAVREVLALARAATIGKDDGHE